MDQLIEEYKSKILRERIESGFKMVYLNYTEQLIVKKTILIYSELLKQNNSSYLIDKEASKNTFWLAQ